MRVCYNGARLQITSRIEYWEASNDFLPAYLRAAEMVNLPADRVHITPVKH